MFDIKMIVGALLYLIFAPVIGCLLAGVDRKISARMQGRYGPPLLQPLYDVRKLFEKEAITVNTGQDFFIVCMFVFVVITGCLFFAGTNLLIVIFTLTTSAIFLVIAGYSSNSPYSQLGAQRELLQMMSYEPMVLIAAVGMYMVNDSFNVRDIIGASKPTSDMFFHGVSLVPMIGIFLGYIYILTMKLRKSPFDLSMSHHAHQELVKGITTEFSGRTLAAIEISHWYENVFLLGFVFLFFGNGSFRGILFGVLAILVLYFIEIVIDNCNARMKWQFALKSSWAVTIVLGGANLLILYFFSLYNVW